MTDTAIILAAGRGSRLDVHGQAEDYAKPLMVLGGLTLLERTVQACRVAGVRRILVVTGFRATRVAAEAERVSLGDVECVHNPDWREANGVSLLACRERVDGPFALMMSDHIFEPSILADLLQIRPIPGQVTLAVDRKIDQVFDLDDATKCWTEGRHIRRIGKELDSYNAIDCGLFLCSPSIFDDLAEVRADNGDCSLSQGMERVGARGLFEGFDIGPRRWQDVDTPEMLEAALELCDALQGPLHLAAMGVG